ncbi:hypothetical protein Sjap_001388 [Stephania japonica]|uniref:Uncharacterized protein n=1 Tax=Stephania japonica TaxID=461633 RepID=A0AAP0PRF1_9MAGN
MPPPTSPTLHYPSCPHDVLKRHYISLSFSFHLPLDFQKLPPTVVTAISVLESTAHKSQY